MKKLIYITLWGLARWNGRFAATALLCSTGLVVGQANAQDTTIYLSRPDFMRLQWIDGDLLMKECVCKDRNGKVTRELGRIDSCKVYFIHNEKVYNPPMEEDDSQWVHRRERYKRLLAIYKREEQEWIKTEYDITGSVVDNYRLNSDPLYITSVDTVLLEDPVTGEFNEEICTYYSLGRKEINYQKR